MTSDEDIKQIKNRIDIISNIKTDNDNISPEDLIEILENDPRVKRVSASNDILEIYTNEIVLDIDNVYVPDRFRRSVAERHKKLNFGEYVILIKPGFMPVAIPYDLTSYNIPPMYRRYNTLSYTNDHFARGYEVYSESSSLKLNAFNLTSWYDSPVGRQLGCREMPNDGSYKHYSVIIPHPHVNQEGHICYGNIRQMIYDAYEINSLSFIIQLTLDVLFSYNDDAPYYCLWRQNACSCCPSLGTQICNTCECMNCINLRNSDKCIKCPNFRSPSLSGLIVVKKNIMLIYAHDASIPKADRLKTMTEEIDAFIEEYAENHPDTDADNLRYNLENGYIDDILQEDYDNF